mmetsp:Transcript_66403/g.103738  ORF Transcript_66403/g.103738 Transcript_66403/m.103738 type:complete len:82 (+) Transcript_66403:2-247(+)
MPLDILHDRDSLCCSIFLDAQDYCDLNGLTCNRNLEVESRSVAGLGVEVAASASDLVKLPGSKAGSSVGVELAGSFVSVSC